MEAGVVTLPAEFFCQERMAASGDAGSLVATEIVDPDENDMWIRFSVAYVDDTQVQKVCERLAESEESFGWKLVSILKGIEADKL
jgi:hypothetical protein